MPKVIYLKDLCSGVAGSVHDLQDYEASTLIRMGVAELADSEQGKVEPEPVKPSEIPTDGLLLNLNGAPVVGDFGDLIPQPAPEVEQKEVPETVVQAEAPKKSSKKSKG